MGASKERSIKTGLTTRVWVIVILMLILNIVQSIFTQTFSLWWAYRSWIPPPFIFWVVTIYFLSKANTTFKFSKQEFAILLVASFLISSTFTYGYYFSGAYGLAVLPGWGQFVPIWMLTHDPYRNIAIKFVQSWMAPTSSVAINSILLGGVVDWGAWLPSIMFWSTFLIVLIMFEVFWGFFLRKPLIEDEKLAFPGIQIGGHLINYATDEVDGKPKLFNFKLSIGKVFWGAFIAGFAVTFLDTARYFIPTIPSSAYIGVWTIDLTPYTKALFPGAYFYSQIRVTDILVFLLAPVDFLATAVIGWFLFLVLYPVIGIRAGILPYTSGVETNYLYYGANYGPFKWYLFLQWGFPVGIGLWLVYINRKHFKDVFQSIFSKDSDKEDGVPYKFISFGAIGFTLALFILLVALGMPIQLAIFSLLIQILINYGYIRLMGDSFEFMGHGQYWQYFRYDVGQFTGAWGPIPAGTQTAFNSMLLGIAMMNNGTRLGNLSVIHQFKTYKIGDMNETSARDILLVSIVITITAAIIAPIFYVWWFHNFGGLSKLSFVGNAWFTEHSNYVYWFTSASPPVSTSIFERYALLVLGIIVPIIMYILRLRFAWFFLNPTGFLILTAAWLSWGPAFIALILRYVIDKYGGVKLWESHILPGIVGFLVGYGVNAALISFLATFMIALPKVL
jgi:hypothetical protein